MSKIGGSPTLILKPEDSITKFEENIKEYNDVEKLNNIPPQKIISETSSLNKETSFENYTSLDLLNHIKPAIPTSLISPQNYDKICHLASFLNGRITSFFGFETRLNSDDPHADYLFAISILKQERKNLKKSINHLPKEFFMKPEWGQVKCFVENWANPNTCVYNNVIGLWFEFDTADTIKDIYVPSIFAQIKPFRLTKNNDIKDIYWITRDALPLLTGSESPPSIEKHCYNAIKKLPDNAYVLHFASMIARPTDLLRLCIKGLNTENILSYLKKVDWDGDFSEFSKIIKKYGEKANKIWLQINLTNKGISPKIGIEFYKNPNKYHQQNGWGSFISDLIKDGLCNPWKATALLEFPGFFCNNNEKFDLDRFSPWIKTNTKIKSLSIVRFINHIKMSYAPGNIEFKGYPGVKLLTE